MTMGSTEVLINKSEERKMPKKYISNVHDNRKHRGNMSLKESEAPHREREADASMPA